MDASKEGRGRIVKVCMGARKGGGEWFKCECEQGWEGEDSLSIDGSREGKLSKV